MKKYIKYYSEADKRYKRVAVGENTTIATSLIADGMEVKFVDKRTGETRFYIKLLVDIKELESLCQNLIDTRLNACVEMLTRQMFTEDFTAFLNSGCRSLPAGKVGRYWGSIFLLFLLMVQGEQGAGIQKLADDFRKILN